MHVFVHHLAALGWGWVAAFAVLDVAAIAAAARAIGHRGTKLAFRCFLLNLGVMLLSGGVTAATILTGLGSAFGAVGSTTDPSHKAQVLAGGISVAMNGAALGIVSTLIAGLAMLVSLIAGVAFQRPSTQERA